MSTSICAGSLLFATQPAHAEAGAEGDPIVVTAQRRPERVEDVPLSLTAVSGEQLDRLQVTDTANLDKLVPSLVMTRSGAFTQPYLRGIGKRSTLGVENSVATYIDGVYLASSIGALLDMVGLDRVEVLNGPQGTLFGRNTSAGVIQIVTKDPSAEETGKAVLRAGTGGFLRGDLYASGGNDRLAANFAASLSTNGGYGDNQATGRRDLGEVGHSVVIRSKWIWRPADPVTLTLAGDYQDLDHDFASLPLEGYPAIGAPRVRAFRDRDQDASTRYQFRHGGVSLKADAEIGGLRLMSLSAARWVHALYGADLDAGPQKLLVGLPEAEQSQYSQELQLQSREGLLISWVGGLYYIHIEESYVPTAFFYGGAYSAMLGGRTEQILTDTGKVNSYAAYGQGSVPLGDRTNVTAGLRYTIERRSVRASGERRFATAPFIRPIPGLPLPGDPPLEASRTFRLWSWRAALDHRFSEALMAYASASSGFQSGGWNLQTPQAPPFEPETLVAFEAGFKYAPSRSWLRADASVFHYRYSDMQVSVFTPLGSATTNASSATISGIELQIGARPDGRTELSFGGRYLRARYNDFPNATCTDFRLGGATLFTQISCDATGNHLPFAPKFKFNAGVMRQVPLGSAGALVLAANLAYVSGQYSEPDNVVRQEGYATIDASAEWRPDSSGFALRLWASNLTNQDHYDGLAVFPTAAVFYRPAAPRRIGIAASVDF